MRWQIFLPNFYKCQCRYRRFIRRNSNESIVRARKIEEVEGEVILPVDFQCSARRIEYCDKGGVKYGEKPGNPRRIYRLSGFQPAHKVKWTMQQRTSKWCPRRWRWSSVPFVVFFRPSLCALSLKCDISSSRFDCFHENSKRNVRARSRWTSCNKFETFLTIVSHHTLRRKWRNSKTKVT